ncbi:MULTISPECIES: BamA/OMP85 family outer membrane protein [Dialister]|jgi:outer membrane protein insertion porin family|uniref:Outer membrane protein assembly factor n=3 Tax=Dialister hominis TaxID=2582419 RepID=A0A8D4UUD3_9FIRM|nr:MULTISPECIES: BamA/TamA family outer membrane protein [Dialister]UYJ16331.1 MAG: BamA/TamA family outer membrane protein [Veillonellaceae bacterium]MBS6412871.1 BamA/TamA family outer membrane protein [Dialister sp.]MCH3912283.1 BamA/TamA family outer membrane protein [Dialister sp.]MCH3929962.1 BamA/TamA family outer membrane protein [Dialister sp.]MEE1350066.1 BamA/TamA family outer membrane protein [Dialister hominis]
MITTKHKKAVILSALMFSLTGASAYAQAPGIAGSQNGMSQSSMIDVKSGQATGKVGEITDKTDKAANEEPAVMVQQSQQTVAVGDASLYLSSNDDSAIEAQVGKTITSVDFEGIPEEVKAKLAPLIQSKPGSTVTVEGIRNDVASLGSIGVFSQIRPVFVSVPEGVKLTYQLVSNPVVKNVEFSGNTVFTSDYLKSIMQIPKDSVLNFVLVNQKLREIEDLYLKQGYMLVSIPNVQVSADGTLHIDISEGIVEDIVIVGNEKTKNYVITRELKLKKGKPFNKFLASRSMERLYNLGYFEDVNMKLLPGKTNEHDVIIEIDVIEQKTGIVTVGAGYSDADGTVGIIELGDTNFRGTGDKVNLHWEFGGAGDGKNYTLSYTRPWINDNGDSLGASIFNRIYEYDDYDANGDKVAEYDKRRKGWNLTWGHVSDEYRTNYFNFESSKESYDDHDGFETGEVMDKYLAKNNITDYHDSDWYKAIMDNFGTTNSFTFTHVFDNRDNYFNASKGRRISFAAQWGGHGLGGDYDFYKFTAEGRFYKALGNGHILALRLMGGYIDGDVSYGNLFDLGGSDTLRGYEDDQFKGKKMYAATLEYRFPIAKKVQGVLFTDAGSTWGIDEGKIPWYTDDDSLNWSVGVGIRLQTPIGPIRLDYGHGDRNKFNFSFGTQF